MKAPFVPYVLIMLSCFCVYFPANSQGTIQRSEGRFLASLDFNPASGIYNGRKNRIQNSSNLPSFPDEYRESGIKVNGMVKAAVLTMEWWTLFGEPVENYNFQWTTSGRYQVYQEGGAGYTVERNKLAKYPDLLLRFDAIKPLDVKFVIYWRFDFDTYKRIHSSFSAGFNYNVTTNVEEGLLFEPSGKNPLSVPGIRKGKGENFIDKKFNTHQHYEIYADAKKSWLQEFNQAKNITIDQFYVTSARWPVKEMLTIATLFEQYEKGEKKPSPMEEVQAALVQVRETQPYARNDFWGETDQVKKDTFMFVTVNGKTGIKNGYGKYIVPTTYKEISQNNQGTLFIARMEGKRYQRPSERAYIQFPIQSDIYSIKGKLLLTYTNAYPKFIESVNCILVRTPTGVSLVDAETLQTLFQVSYPNPYTEYQGYFHGITIPADIVQTFPVAEYIGPNCGSSSTGCGTRSRTHVYGITKSKQVRFLGTYQ